MINLKSYVSPTYNGMKLFKNSTLISINIYNPTTKALIKQEETNVCWDADKMVVFFAATSWFFKKYYHFFSTPANICPFLFFI